MKQQRRPEGMKLSTRRWGFVDATISHKWNTQSKTIPRILIRNDADTLEYLSRLPVDFNIFFYFKGFILHTKYTKYTDYSLECSIELLKKSFFVFIRGTLFTKKMSKKLASSLVEIRDVTRPGSDNEHASFFEK